MAAAARPYWTGFLKLSLVTIAVRLYTAATERERIRFHMIHEPTGERVRQQLVVPGTGPVERDEIAVRIFSETAFGCRRAEASERRQSSLVIVLKSASVC